MAGARAALRVLRRPRRPRRVREEYAERKQRRIVELIEAGEFTAFPDALRFVLADARRRASRWPPLRRRRTPTLFLRADPARHVRRRAGSAVRLPAARDDAAGRRRRRHLGPRLRARQAGSRDLPDRRGRARARRRSSASSSRTPWRASPPPRRAGWRRSASRARTIAHLLAAAAADLVVDVAR